MAKKNSNAGWLKYAVTALLLAVAFKLLTNTRGNQVPQSPPGIISSKLERNHLSRFIARGGRSLLTVGRSCATCPRGLFASRNIAQGEMAISVPYRIGMPLKKLPMAPYMAEYAYYLLVAAYVSPEFNRSHPYFWETLPTQEENLDLCSLSDAELDDLQSTHMKEEVINLRDIAMHMYQGYVKIEEHKYQALPDALRSNAVSLEMFHHVISMVRSRSFKVNESGGKRLYLLPVLDMANHAHEGNLSPPTNNGTHMIQYAAKPIKKGQEAVWNYDPSKMYRNDKSMLSYGFVVDKPASRSFRSSVSSSVIRGTPLCAMDLPDYELRSKIQEYPENDDGYYGPNGSHNTQEEYDRLKNILAEMPTTLQEDEALLKSGKLPTWQKEMIVKFRIARKCAIQNAMHAIAKETKVKK